MDAKNARPTADHVDAINQLFTEFQLAYHNQFHKAFAGDEQITMAKQLWMNTLCDLPAQRIVAAARRAIRESEYLPTLHTIRKLSDPRPEDLGLPDAHSAYIEACRAASPKGEQHWSHPAVYHAGKASDWFFLANNPENKAYAVFKRNYEILCQRVLDGDELTIPVPKALPETIHQPLSNAERKERMQQLREDLDI